MRNIIKTEFLKLKRYSVIKAGIIMTTLSPLLSLFYSTANGGPTWTFDYFMQQVMISNCTLFFPIIIALIAGYIITREYTDDTMKNILTIPIPYKQLLSGKLLILLLLTISFSLIGCVIALVINIIVGFPGVHFGNLLNMFIRVTGANLHILHQQIGKKDRFLRSFLGKQFIPLFAKLRNPAFEIFNKLPDGLHQTIGGFDFSVQVADVRLNPTLFHLPDSSPFMDGRDNIKPLSFVRTEIYSFRAVVGFQIAVLDF